MYLNKYFATFVLFITVFIVLSRTELLSNDIPKSRNEPVKYSKLSETTVNLVETLRKQIKTKEDELHKAEIINKNFEKMVQLVNILGQVDTFLTEKTKMLIKKLAALADVNTNENKK